MYGTIIIGGYSMNANCESCVHCHPIYDSTLVGPLVRDKVFYCDHFESLYCEYSQCTLGYKKRRERKEGCV